ncbi:hypothetical protein [Nesterenkonia massiliensis]|uniref:restriction endonuclease subunit S n=1 Tax=Nesterenkonia massiliensis TaxID=1232429 RepID=UPI0004096789|nr:hypothetical protein [Nesterenkonia massiliensis]
MQEIGYQGIEPGDLVIHAMDGFAGAIGVAQDRGKSSPVYSVLTPRQAQTAYVPFYAYVLRNYALSGLVQSFAQGVRERSTEFRWNTSKTVLVPAPGYGTQQTIADYLDHETAEIDAFIADLEALIKLEEERRIATIDAHLDAGEPVMVPMKHLGTLRSGLTLGTKYTEPVEEFPYLRVANVQTNYVDLTDVATVRVPQRVADTNRLQPGDILMTEGGDRDKLGRGAIWDGSVPNMLHQNHIFSFRCAEALSPEYLVLVLESTWARDYFDLTARQSTNLASTNSTTVRSFLVPYRDRGAQERLVKALHAALAKVADAVHDSRKAIALAKERRAALISAAVTGQIDVTAKHKPAAEQLEEDIAQLA